MDEDREDHIRPDHQPQRYEVAYELHHGHHELLAVLVMVVILRLVDPAPVHMPVEVLVRRQVRVRIKHKEGEERDDKRRAPAEQRVA